MNYRKKAMLMAGALLCLNLSIYSQSISLKMSNVSVKKAMTELQTKSGYSFVYIAGDVDTDRTVSINASQLKDAVAQILKGQNVSYEIQGKNIVIKKGSQQQVTSGKRKKVTGTVKDANGEPIIEELVGNIFDEYDDVEKDYEKIDENTFMIDGSVSIYELRKILNVDIPEGDYDTLSGYLIELLGRIPKDDEKPVIETEKVTYKIEEYEEKRIIWVKACKNQTVKEKEQDNKEDED